MKNAIFISYRREDTSHAAGRLHAELSRIFPQSEIFIDIDDLPPGVDFRKAIDDAVKACDAVLVCIGGKWQGASAQEGKRRLDLANDFVRLEIEAALAREIPVVPVLVDGTPMPQVSDLPDSIKPLAYRNASALRHASFSADVRKLSQGLANILSADVEAEPADKPTTQAAPPAPDNHADEAAQSDANKAPNTWGGMSASTRLIGMALIALPALAYGLWSYWQDASRVTAQTEKVVSKANQSTAVLPERDRVQVGNNLAEKRRLEKLLKENQIDSAELDAMHKNAMDSIRNLSADSSRTVSRSRDSQSASTIALSSLKSLGISSFRTKNGIGIRWEKPIIARSFTNELLRSTVGFAGYLGKLDTIELPGGSRITDLSALKDLQLVSLSLKNVAGVTDLSPLRGMPLTYLDLTGAKGVKDLSPLRNKRVDIEGASIAQLQTLK